LNAIIFTIHPSIVFKFSSDTIILSVLSVTRHFPDDIIFNHSPWPECYQFRETLSSRLCLLLFSRVFPQVLNKELTHHQKSDHFDLTGATLFYSKQVKAVSIPEKGDVLFHLTIFK
jgi:hypothetical protein